VNAVLAALWALDRTENLSVYWVSLRYRHNDRSVAGFLLVVCSFLSKEAQ
jgi:hypothetical protein